MVFRHFRFGRGSRERFRNAHRRDAVVTTWHFQNLGVEVGQIVEGGCAEGGAFLLKVVSCEEYFLDQVPPEVATALGFENPASFLERVRLNSPGCRGEEAISVIRYRVLAEQGAR